jgi:hypothetical protein
MRGKAEWDWFKTHNKIVMTEDTRGMVAIMDGKPAAACAISHFQGYSVEGHQVILRPIVIRYGWFEVMCDAMYGSCVEVLYGMVPANNVKSLKLHKHMGMQETGRIPNASAPGIDYIVMSLQRQDCRYLEENDE